MTFLSPPLERVVRRVTAAGLVGASCLSCATPAAAAEPALSAQRSTPGDVNDRDSLLTLNALQALMKDETLRPLNLGVSVHDHIITLWGPVPTVELARHAQEVLHQVAGVADVIDDLYLEPPPEPTIDSFPTPLPGPRSAPHQNGIGQNPVPAAALARLEDMQGAGTSAPLQWQPARHASGAGLPAPLAPAGQPLPLQRVLEPPQVALAGHSPVTVHKTPVTLMAPVPLTPQVGRLAQAIDQLCQADGRFCAIRPQVEDGIVYLHGGASQSADLFELAKAIARLPGVQQVILNDVTVPAHP